MMSPTSLISRMPGVGTSTAEVARLICARVGSKSRIVQRQIDAYAPNIAMDSSLAGAVLGWEPKLSLAEGLAQIVGKPGTGGVPASPGGERRVGPI